MRTEFLCVSVLRVASGPRGKLASCKSALNPPVVYSTDRSKAVVPVLVLVFLKRNIKGHNQDLKSTAYKTLVRPQLEYASTSGLPTQLQILLKLKQFSAGQPDGLPVITSAPLV